MPPKSEALKALGAALREERDRQARSQQDVAADAGVKREYLASTERGERNLAYESLLKLVGALGVPLSRVVARAERLREDRE